MAARRHEKLEEQAVAAMTIAKISQQELAWLKKQLQKQQAISEAMWALLKAALSLSDEALADEVMRITESRRGRPKVADLCTSCGRTLQDGRTACIYCGHIVERHQVF